ncbi:hypothetical protein [Rhodococcus koreensis]
MNSHSEPLFSWDSRRVVLPRTLAPIADAASDSQRRDRTGVTLDVSLTIGQRSGRLLAYHDADWDAEYVVLMIGQILGEEDVPVRVVDEETLLVEGSRCTRLAEILIAASPIGAGLGTQRVDRRIVDTQLCTGGPIRDMLGLSGAVSVESQWCQVAATYAAA